MNIRTVLLACLCWVGPATSFSQNKSDFSFGYVDPMQKVFREDVFSAYDPASIEAIRGEPANLQFVFRCPVQALGIHVENIRIASGASVLGDVSVRYVGYVRSSIPEKFPSRDRLQPVSGLYPDPLLEAPSVDVAAGASQPVWVTVQIPKDAAKGTYSGSLELHGSTANGPFVLKTTFTITVYPILLGSQSLSVENILTFDNDRIGGTKGTLAAMNDGKAVTPYSDTYWTLVRSMARMMHAYRCNVIMLHPQHIIDYGYADGKFTFDWSKFDKLVQVFQEEHVIGRIDGGYLAGRNGGWTAPYELIYYVMDKQQNKIVSRAGELNNPDLINFFSQYIPALVEHLKAKNLYSIYVQHIGDEPVAENLSTWLAIKRFITGLAPDMRFIETCQVADANMDLGVWVPVLDLFATHYDFYKDRAAKGEEVWFYNAWVPQGEYANRLAESPLIKTRLIQWINFKYAATGYLHWGFNHWGGSNPYTDLSSGGWTGGDAFITYPKAGGMLSSIRLEAMRDGIVDYEMLVRLGRTDPGEAEKIAGSIIRGFTDYQTDLHAFDAARHRLLVELSKNM